MEIQIRLIYYLLKCVVNGFLSLCSLFMYQSVHTTTNLKNSITKRQKPIYNLFAKKQFIIYGGYVIRFSQQSVNLAWIFNFPDYFCIVKNFRFYISSFCSTVYPRVVSQPAMLSKLSGGCQQAQQQAQQQQIQQQVQQHVNKVTSGCRHH